MLNYEHQEQCAVFHWASLAERQYPMLKWLHSSQSGEKFSNVKQAVRAKRAGMKKGIADIFLPYPRFRYCPNMCGAKRMIYSGLYIEMKKPIVKGQSKPVISKEQREFLEYANSVGYCAKVCYGASEAIECIKEYLKELE